MSGLVFEAPDEKPLILRVRKNGELVEHTFRILPLVRERYEAVMVCQREVNQRQRDGGDDLDIAPFFAELCDQLVESTNGPETITSMWNDGVLPLRMLAGISAALLKEAVGDPPA